MRFEFATANRIVFGPGVLQQVAPIAAEHGRRPLVVTGRRSDRAALLLELLRQSGLTPTVFAVTGEPTVDLARAGMSQARQAGCDQVIGIGGGSVLDAGKAIAMLLTNGGDPIDYIEVVGRGQAITQRSAPMIAIPTTAGTGSEVTRNAVLGSTEHKVKASLRAATMLPTVALVDPELTYSMSPDVTASTGLDAFTQCLEPFVSVRANPLTDSLCREGMLRAARSLSRAYENGEDAAARENMAVASL